MNILLYLHQYPAFGGIETVTTMLARQFYADGHRVRIVSVQARDSTNQLDQLPPNTWRGLPSEQIDSPSNLVALKDELIAFVPDVVLFQDSYVPIEGLLFLALKEADCRTPVVFCEHNSPLYWWHGQLRRPWTLRGIAFRLYKPVFYWREYLRQRRRRLNLMAHVAQYVVLAKAYMSQIRFIIGRKLSSRLSVIYNPVAPMADCVDPATLAKEKVLLFVGSLIPRKGVRRVIDAWTQLEPRQKGWRLEIVGDGSQRAGLEAYVRSRGLRRVVFAGHQTDTESYYRRASILAVASDFEGWPMVIGEAMRAGCVPVVYDSFAAVPEMIEDGVSGCIVRHYDENTFVRTIASMMDDSSRRRQMQERAIDYAQRFQIRTIARQWYGLFEKVVNQEGV
jgi:glycosyltransferase involved in cell wall biosynthesis